MFSDDFVPFSLKEKSGKYFIGRNEYDMLYAESEARKWERKGQVDTNAWHPRFANDEESCVVQTFTKYELHVQANIFQALQYSVINLNEIHIYNCTLDAEHITLSSMPPALRKLRIIEARIRGSEKWLVKFIGDLDAQRKESNMILFEWRQRPKKVINLSIYTRAVYKTSLPFSLMDCTTGSPITIHDSLMNDSKGKTAALKSAITSLVTSRILGLTWMLQPNGLVTLTSSCERNLDRICKELNSKEDSTDFSLLHLPEEVLLRILGNLGIVDSHSMARTCKTMKRIVQDHTLIK